MHTTFEELLAPLEKYLEVQGTQIDKQTDSRKLFFADFTKKLIYAFVMGIPSLRQLITDLETNENCESLKLNLTPFSTMKDGFTRFPSKFFEKLYQQVLKNCHWLRIEAFDELGVFQLVDGSIFPTLRSMDWASFRKTRKAVRLHLSFELNRMLPIEFIGLKAKSSERSFLLKILQPKITYIADRGYFSFNLAAQIESAKAFFILRIKNNIRVSQSMDLKPSCSQGQKIPLCFKKLRDQLVRFESDKHAKVYRLICFEVLQSQFTICTNRLDLTTLQIIILYAFRWQVELLFKFIKRNLKGIHLFNNTENGVNIQFYILMITTILQLRIKQVVTVISNENQKCADVDELENLNNIEQIPTHLGHCPDLWIESLTKSLQKYWKISCHWIRRLQNFICKPFDSNLISKLSAI